MNRTVEGIVAMLRAGGGDTVDVEVKAAAGGFPESLTATLSALANLPGGGTVVLGLDESNGFRPVPIDVGGLKQALGSKARSFQPPISVSIEDGVVDGLPVVVARIRECDPAHKPCRAADGIAHLRSWDGDHRVTPLDEQAFLLQRGHQTADQNPVHGASVEDFDPLIMAQWHRNVVAGDPRGLGRFTNDERLLRAGVVTAQGVPTLAGLVALGVHPQQFYPRLSLQLTSIRDGSRSEALTVLTGSLPVLLDSAMDWARKVLPTEQRVGDDGHVRNTPVVPLVSFREIVSNALVHRDYSDWAIGFAAEVRVYQDRIVVMNPGGLHGITAERLGYEHMTTSRNARLVAIAQHVTSPDTGGRVIEALSTGLAVVRSELAAAGMPAPVFVDSGVRFTVVLKYADVIHRDPMEGRSQVERDVYAALVMGPRTAKDLASVVGTGVPNIRKALRALRASDLIRIDGGKGRQTTYERFVV